MTSSTLDPKPTRREVQILRLRALGHKTESIAAELGIAPATVDNFLNKTYRRYDAHCLADALRGVGWLIVPGEELS